jgi:hypothetical protein
VGRRSAHFGRVALISARSYQLSVKIGVRSLDPFAYGALTGELGFPIALLPPIKLIGGERGTRTLDLGLIFSTTYRVASVANGTTRHQDGPSLLR